MQNKYPVVIGLMILVLASWVVTEAFSGEGGLHDYEVSALNKDWKSRLNQDVKVAGIVVENSLRGDLERLKVEFDIEDETGDTLTVAYNRLLPDPFDYGREVIIEGTVSGKGKLAARNITVKCPSRYQDGALPNEAKPEKYEKSPLMLRLGQGSSAQNGAGTYGGAVENTAGTMGTPAAAGEAETGEAGAENYGAGDTPAAEGY